MLQMFTEDELGFAKIDDVGSIAFIKRVRTVSPYDVWYVVEQLESCDDFRKRTTRTYADLITANDDYQKRLTLMKMKGAPEC